MKKFGKIALLTLFIAVCLGIFAACGGNGFSLTYTAGTGGSISGIKNQTVKKGENGTKVTAEPDNGYRFDKWSDGITTAERRDENVSENISVTAEFSAILTVTLKYNASAGGSISGSINQIIEKGTSGTTVTALPDFGYKFVKWSDNITSAERTDTVVNSNITVTAQFEFMNDTTNFGGGSGIEENPYKISSPAHLRNIPLFPNANYKLTGNINLSSLTNFEPLCGELPFNGILDGGDFTIRNLKIDTVSHYAGLFAVIGISGKVYNLNIVGAEITAYGNAGGNIAGILAGFCTGTVENVAVAGKVTVSNDSHVDAGGLIGESLGNGNISDCLSYGEVTATSFGATSRAGGLIGQIIGSIENCDAYVKVAAIGYSGARAGGLVGYGSVDISNCYTVGDVSASGAGASYAGGLIGYIHGDTGILNSRADGDVTANSSAGGSTGAGGLVGIMGNGGNYSVSGSCARGSVSAQSGSSGAMAGGLVGVSFGSSTIENCYAVGDTSASSAGVAIVGGLFGAGNGENAAYNILNSYARGKVSGTAGSFFAGGIAGSMNGTVANCHWLYHGDGAAEFAIGALGSAVNTVKYTDETAMMNDAITGLLNAGGNAWVAVTGGLPILRWQI